MKLRVYVSSIRRVKSLLATCSKRFSQTKKKLHDTLRAVWLRIVDWDSRGLGRLQNCETLYLRNETDINTKHLKRCVTRNVL